MFGDNDPEIAPFFAKFLGEGPQKPTVAVRRDGRIRPARFAEDRVPLTNGLAVGLAGASAMLEDAAAPRARVRSERTEAFHRMLEEMANDIMMHGPHVPVMPSREVTPRSRPPSPIQDPQEPVAGYGETSPPLVLQDAEDFQEQSDEESPDEPMTDFLVTVSGDDANRRFPPTDFGATQYQQWCQSSVTDLPPNHIRVCVEIDTGRRILNNIEVDLDSSLEDLFVRVEKKVKKEVSSLITKHGLKLERADLPVKWSGLQDGDSISALYHKHPPVQERKFKVVSPSRLSPSHDRLAQLWAHQPVSMGAFGDTIAQAAGPDAPHMANTAPTQGLVNANDGAPSGIDLPNHWTGGLGLTGAIQSADLNLVPPVPPGSEENGYSVEDDRGCNAYLPAPPSVMPDEFEDLPTDAFTTPRRPADEVDADSPNKPHPSLKVAASSPPPATATTAAATPKSSRFSDLSQAPTPSRRLAGTPGPPRVDAEEFKRKMAEKQKQNDAIWANIAATLEPNKLEPTKRTLLSHAASAGTLGKKLPPSLSTLRDSRRLR